MPGVRSIGRGILVIAAGAVAGLVLTAGGASAHVTEVELAAIGLVFGAGAVTIARRARRKPVHPGVSQS